MGDQLLTTAQVAEKLHISVAHAYKLLKDGKIPTVRFGKLVRVNKEDLDKYIYEKTGLGTKGEGNDAPGAG
jgi:excisionase family DNA binding protein